LKSRKLGIESQGEGEEGGNPESLETGGNMMLTGKKRDIRGGSKKDHEKVCRVVSG